jgi:DNA-binding response OmpR family regulator
MPAQRRILVVDDDRGILQGLTEYLSDEGFDVVGAETIKAAGEALRDHRPDLAVLDVKLPDGNGVDFLRTLRSAGDATPVILLTAQREEVDRILGLEMGADDYMSKPFSPRELLARMKAVLRRVHPSEDGHVDETLPPSYRFAGFVANPATRTVLNETTGRDLQFTGGEFDVLMVLLERPNRLLSREQILEYTRGHRVEPDPFDRSVDVHISRIRSKLKDEGSPEGTIKTARGSGYQLSVKVEKIDTVLEGA